MLLEQTPKGRRSLESYRGLVADDILDEALSLARDLSGLRIVHLNSTARGGGVAEILRSLVPLMRGIGLDTCWYVMAPSRQRDFFAVTRHIHSLLQGMEGELTPEERSLYLSVVAEEANGLVSRRPGHEVWFMHDPQLLPLLSYMDGSTPRLSFWICHIDMSSPNRATLEGLLSLMALYTGAVFSSSAYVPSGLTGIPSHVIPPTIDPLAVKNMAMNVGDARRLMALMGIDTSRPLVTQVSRFDRWKDPKGVIDAYRLAKQQVAGLQLALMGVIEAQDDPEAHLTLKEVCEYTQGDPDVHLIWDPHSLPEDIDQVVNALQTGPKLLCRSP